jgi:hypothetical protein
LLRRTCGPPLVNLLRAGGEAAHDKLHTAYCLLPTTTMSNPLNFPFEDQLPSEPEGPADDEPTADEQIEAALDYEAQLRLWVRAILPLLQLRSHDSDPSPRVQLAFDKMHIAACERLERLMRSDIVPEKT